MNTPMTDNELKMVLNTAIEEMSRLNSRCENLSAAIRELIAASPDLPAATRGRIESLLAAYPREARSRWLAKAAALYKRSLEKESPEYSLKS